MRAYLEMLTTIRATIADAIAHGRSLADVIALKPTAPFDARYGQGSFVNPDQFAEALYRSLMMQRKADAVNRGVR